MSEAENTYWTHHCQCLSCERYRDQNQGKWNLAIIRAFVDKATKHVEPLEGQPNYYGQFYIAIKEFLDEMEADNVL